MPRERTVGSALALGIGAGLAGTALMTAWQETVAHLRRRTTPRHMLDEDPWAHAPAPAQVGRRAVQTLTGRDVPPARIPFFTNAVHWGFGTGMGVLYAVARRRAPVRAGLGGPVFGLAVWAQSYATLVPMGLYEPPWHYPARTIAKDISYHLVYGAGTALGYEALARVRQR